MIDIVTRDRRIDLIRLEKEELTPHLTHDTIMMMLSHA